MSSRGIPKTKEIRATLRKQAEDRQAESDKLTTQQKLDRLPATGSNKQRARYLAALEKEKAAPVAPVASVTPETKDEVKEKKAAKEEQKRLKKENKQ